MAIVISLNCHKPFSTLPQSQNHSFNPLKSLSINHIHTFTISTSFKTPRHPRLSFHRSNSDSDQNHLQDDEVNSLGVKAALSILRFYKREISPVLPKSCRYVPTCSEYSMEAYKKYGVVKGTVLTAWRLCRCNPLGGSGFDPPRWFDEDGPPEE